MRIVNDIRDLSKSQIRQSAITIGKFDGIHLGHALLLNEAIRMKTDEKKAMAITFEPIQNKQCYLNSKEEKYKILGEMGIDVVLELNDNINWKVMTPQEFVEDLLIEKLSMKNLVVGTDFCFGKDRAGNVELLEQLSHTFDFNLSVFEKMTTKEENGKSVIISSTRIKDLIKEGRIQEANTLMGRPYSVLGKVVHGNAIGRKIGFPTLNQIPHPDKLLPPDGVYVTQVRVKNTWYRSISNLGVKPTINMGQTRGIETFLFDFSGDLYDELLDVQLLKFIRPEAKFDNLDQLKERIQLDIQIAKNFKS